MNVQTYICATRFHKAKRSESNNSPKKKMHIHIKNEMYTQQHCLYDNGFSYCKECVCSVLHIIRKRPCVAVVIICIRYAYCRQLFLYELLLLSLLLFIQYSEAIFFVSVCVFYLFSFFSAKNNPINASLDLETHS